MGCASKYLIGMQTLPGNQVKQQDNAQHHLTHNNEPEIDRVVPTVDHGTVAVIVAGGDAAADSDKARIQDQHNP